MTLFLSAPRIQINGGSPINVAGVTFNELVAERPAPRAPRAFVGMRSMVRSFTIEAEWTDEGLAFLDRLLGIWRGAEHRRAANRQLLARHRARRGRS